MERKCKKCGQTKDLETGFYLTGRKNDKPDARHYTCKDCTKKRVSARHKQDPTAYRRAHLKRKYGITIEEYDEMVKLQNSSCAICGCKEPGGKHDNQHWFVDHDHVTGKVRDLLCFDCNIVLGIIKDSPEHLGRMITYILKHKND